MSIESYYAGRCVLSRNYLPLEIVPPKEALDAARPGVPYRVTLHGRTFDSPRLTQAYGRDYTYSGQEHLALPVPGWLASIIGWAELTYKTRFNGALVNWYINGHNYIAPHSDDESALQDNCPILTISLGQPRKLRFRLKHDKTSQSLDMETPHGSCIAMYPPTQTYCTHEIVKVSGEKGLNVQERVSITLRAFTV